jgi:hypothetical protein
MKIMAYVSSADPHSTKARPSRLSFAENDGLNLLTQFSPLEISSPRSHYTGWMVTARTLYGHEVVTVNGEVDTTDGPLGEHC